MACSGKSYDLDGEFKLAPNMGVKVSHLLVLKAQWFWHREGEETGGPLRCRPPKVRSLIWPASWGGFLYFTRGQPVKVCV